jgi:hypothetical protein
MTNSSFLLASLPPHDKASLSTLRDQVQTAWNQETPHAITPAELQILVAWVNLLGASGGGQSAVTGRVAEIFDNSAFFDGLVTGDTVKFSAPIIAAAKVTRSGPPISPQSTRPVADRRDLGAILMAEIQKDAAALGQPVVATNTVEQQGGLDVHSRSADLPSDPNGDDARQAAEHIGVGTAVAGAAVGTVGFVSVLALLALPALVVGGIGYGIYRASKKVAEVVEE